MFGMSVPALAQEGIQESAKFMETLVTQIKTLLSADNVLGQERVVSETTIIPVVAYGFGFGAGSGSGGDEKGRGSGAGGGAGGSIMPTSILVITKDGDVKVLAAKKGIISDMMATFIPIAIEAIKAKARAMEKPEMPETPPSEEEKKPE
jgi:uncharacterized spore protein YtfJ